MTNFDWLDEILNKHRSETWSTGWNNKATEEAKSAIATHFEAELLKRETKRLKHLALVWKGTNAGKIFADELVKLNRPTPIPTTKEEYVKLANEVADIVDSEKLNAAEGKENL